MTLEFQHIASAGTSPRSQTTSSASISSNCSLTSSFPTACHFFGLRTNQRKPNSLLVSHTGLAYLWLLHANVLLSYTWITFKAFFFFFFLPFLTIKFSHFPACLGVYQTHSMVTNSRLPCYSYSSQ